MAWPGRMPRKCAIVEGNEHAFVSPNHYLSICPGSKRAVLVRLCFLTLRSLMTLTQKSQYVLTVNLNVVAGQYAPLASTIMLASELIVPSVRSVQNPLQYLQKA